MMAEALHAAVSRSFRRSASMIRGVMLGREAYPAGSRRYARM